MRNACRAYTAVLVGALLWCGAILLAPVLSGLPEPFSAVGGALYELFSPVCHQIEGRSIAVFGSPLTVCSRCTAVYFGFLAGVLLYPFLRRIDQPVYPPRWIIALAVFPMLLDVLSGWTGLHAVTGATRTLTGAFFGIIVPFVILPALIEAVNEWSQPHRPPLHHPQKGLTDA